MPVVSAAPVAEDTNARLLQNKGRKRKLLLAVAAVTLIAVGAVAWHLMSAPSAKTNAPPVHALAAGGEQEKKAEAPAPPVPPPVAPVAQAVAEPPITPSPEPVAPLVAKPAPTPAPAVANAGEPAAAKPAPSLLSGLNTMQTPGPAAGVKSAGAGAAAGPGLEATAIQRTVRKYSPAVRQNCWQRALNARAPGVPSSAKVTATITVDGAGRVQSVTATGAPRGYPGLAHCIEEAVKGWTFPHSMGETVTQVPFMFVGQ